MNLRQFIKLVAVMLIAYWFAHGLVYFFGDSLRRALDELLGILLYVIAIICAISLVMFTYVDNSAKDFTDLRNEVDREKYKIVQKTLSSLKSEIIANGATVIIFFALERAIKSFVTQMVIANIAKISWLVETVGIALRFSCFAVIALAATSQILGFLIAVEFREQIANNRK